MYFHTVVLNLNLFLRCSRREEAFGNNSPYKIPPAEFPQIPVSHLNLKEFCAAAAENQLLVTNHHRNDCLANSGVTPKFGKNLRRSSFQGV